MKVKSVVQLTKIETYNFKTRVNNRQKNKCTDMKYNGMEEDARRTFEERNLISINSNA